MTKAKRHFTLLELLVAVTVFLLLTTVLAASLGGVANSWKRLSSENRRMQELLSLDRTIKSIVANTIAFSWRDRDDKPFVYFSGQPNSIRLVYQHVPGTYREGGLRFVELSVKENTLLATYQSSPAENPLEEFTDAETSVLSQGVDYIEYSYLDYDPATGWQWLDEWDAGNVHSSIPPAIGIQIFWLDGRWESWLRRTKYGHEAF